MTPELTTVGHAEQFKGCVHLALFGLATSAALYNAAALVTRPSPRLACNVAIYGALAALEVTQVMRHLRASESVR